MTLTEFLLARISDDERSAKAARDRIFPTTWEEDVKEMRNSHVVNFVVIQRPERVLAECKVKRHLVETAKQARQIADATPDLSKQAIALFSAACAFEVVLEGIASVYANHADYQQDWKS